MWIITVKYLGEVNCTVIANGASSLDAINQVVLNMFKGYASPAYEFIARKAVS